MDADKLIDDMAEYAIECIKTVDAQPTADVVEVVRCKDCKRHIENDVGDIFCNYHGVSMLENDYCSYGERA